ncbi:MAG TPA: PH domain-containing protein [Actinomycetota bacterium]|nr:PH domain-containing protein [Actinomycetota bacterium]
MPFPQRLLGEHEEVVYDLRPHWWTLAGPVLLTLLVAVVAVAGWAFLPTSDLQQTGRLAIGGVALLLLLVLVIPRFLRWATTHFVLTTDRLIFRSGVLSKLSKEIPLERVNDVTYSQSFWERLIGAGDLFIESAGERGQSIFQNIPRPEGVQVEIYRQMEANGQRMSGVPRAPSVLEELERLANLRDRGAVTDEEFERKKRDLLDRL